MKVDSQIAMAGVLVFNLLFPAVNGGAIVANAADGGGALDFNYVEGIFTRK